jgi:ankyrin repeat protein
MLLDAQAEIETLDKLGNTPLLLAAEWDRTGTVEKLLGLGANASQANYKGTTA